MLDLYDEFIAVVKALDEAKVEYALCGGLAMAAYDVVRATEDIDLLILTESLDPARAALTPLGFSVAANPMQFQAGKVKIHRLSKMDSESEDFIVVDLLTVDESLSDIWKNRKSIIMKTGSINVVSIDSLIALKKIRNSPQDIEDIRRLEEKHIEN